MVERESLKTILEIVGIWVGAAVGVLAIPDFLTIYKIIISVIAGIALTIFALIYYCII